MVVILAVCTMLPRGWHQTRRQQNSVVHCKYIHSFFVPVDGFVDALDTQRAASRIRSSWKYILSRLRQDCCTKAKKAQSWVLSMEREEVKKCCFFTGLGSDSVNLGRVSNYHKRRRITFDDGKNAWFALLIFIPWPWVSYAPSTNY
jgi:hypothetical protein